MNSTGAAKLADQLSAVDERLREFLSATTLQRSTPSERTCTLTENLDRAERTTDLALTSVADMHDPAAAAEVSELAAESLRLQFALREFLAGRRARTTESLSSSLRRLGAPTTRQSFPQQVCDELAGTAGFGSAMFSGVDYGRLRVLGYTSSTPQVEEQGPREFIPPSDSVEFSAIKGPHTHPRSSTHECTTPGIAAMLGSNDYLVCPIRVGATVPAIMHVAHIAPLVVDTEDAEFFAIYQSAVVATFAREMWTRKATHHYATLQRAVDQIVEDTVRVTHLDFDIDDGAEQALSSSDTHPMPVNHELEELLTKRESEVMRLIASGASNAEIAEKLFIGVETVKSHVKKILRKIGAVNRSEAISLYLDRG
ncbi:response regulator transcription factor [Gordonia aichiensis]|uniref:Putative LuxR family transcriptional regulator n=1 Tax=Gordonia aichiensis NBRC 108223 TaxID=1220583 RepID=L7KJX2_9ACTN|nr:response regulator transcription factor [Gordonia aichiensis]GAC49175.1 putative LuxR family transcriptional regulator [Gordonia aichiensis NBRC 108223]